MSGAAVVSHTFGAVVFFIVAVILCRDQRIWARHPWLVAGCLASAFWATFSAFYAAGLFTHYGFVASLGVLRNVLWCLCLVQILKEARFARYALWFRWRYLQGFLFVLCSGLLLHAAISDFSYAGSVPSAHLEGIFLGHVFLNLLGLVLVEQLYRNARQQQRLELIWLSLALGVLFAYDFYMYANAIFFEVIDSVLWQARGAIAGAIAPLIAMMGIYRRKWSHQIVLSQAVVFRSVVIVACVGYLIVTASASFYIRHYTGTWGEVLQVVFAACSTIMLLLLFSSRMMRARLKNSINRNFFRYRYDYREEWSRFSHVLSHHSKDMTLHQKVIMSLANTVDSPGGALYECKGEKYFTLSSTWGQTTQQVFAGPIDLALVEYMKRTTRVVDVENLVADLPLQNESLSLAWLKTVPWAWLIIPLIHGSKLHGVLLLSRPYSPFELNWEVFNLLKTAGNQAAVCLVQHQVAEELAQAKQFDGFNRLSTFMMHDTKNIIMQLSLILQNSDKHRDNPAFMESVFKTIQGSVRHMEQMMAQLNNGKPLDVSDDFDMLPDISRVVKQRSAAEPTPILINHTKHKRIILTGNKGQFSNIIMHLIENAQDATPAEGQIALLLSGAGDRMILEIKDTGCGMSTAFMRDALFKPFVTTKGSRGMGIGVFEAREYMRAIGGELQVESQVNKGTTFTLIFPMAEIMLEKQMA